MRTSEDWKGNTYTHDDFGNKHDQWGNKYDWKGNKYNIYGSWLSGPDNPKKDTDKPNETMTHSSHPESVLYLIGITAAGIGLFIWLSSINLLKEGIIGISIIGALIIFGFFAKELGSVFDTRSAHQKNLDYLKKLKQND